MNLSENFDKLTLDCGASKTVAGDYWMNSFLQLLPDEERRKIRRKREDRIFRFGNKVRYPSKEEITIPIKIGKLKSFLHVSVVSANIPLLLGRPDMKKLKFTVNFEKDTVYTAITGETFHLEKTKTNLLTLPFIDISLDKDTHDILVMENNTREEKYDKIQKVHKIMCHPSENTLKNFFKDSSDDDDETKEIIEEEERHQDLRWVFQCPGTSTNVLLLI